eukprot:CAMPEP_0183382794 /NCGR_PEP_ID=MMETSP0164_2-20130417/127126_1 /TAXON_ID=221442 /ORGANISM="Coccolithus pelagicus ssp braarudi, Strain PLY182g" /LENGTH=109 /DNA_ID=CAMNT_0025560419 /DNA_START=314 /DNA_END=643 /DNA_ORIENTATION=-
MSTEGKRPASSLEAAAVGAAGVPTADVGGNIETSGSAEKPPADFGEPKPTVTHAFATIITASGGSSTGSPARPLAKSPPSSSTIGSKLPYGKHAATASRSTSDDRGTAT